jgi:RecA/RadA recombinase
MNQGVTEVAGEAGCGKTQLCMVLALQVGTIESKYAVEFTYTHGSRLSFNPI